MMDPVAPMKLGIVGCGNIAEAYARDIASCDQLQLTALTDRHWSRASALADKYGGRVVNGIPDLADAVDLIVNLTPTHAHFDVSRQCLELGRHVYSEKPLAATSAKASQLLELAARHSVRLGCAPASLLGEAQQTAWAIVRSGRAGTIRAVYAEVDWGWIERWHPRPAPFYEYGPLFDVGVYPLSILTAIFGPARRVTAFGRLLMPTRTTASGDSFTVEGPDLQVVMVELEDGPVVRLTASFYVGQHTTNQAAVEFHGDRGSILLEHWFHPDAVVAFADRSEEPGSAYVAVPLVRTPPATPDWSRALVDMVEAIRNRGPLRASGEHAAHVVDIVAAAELSMSKGGASVDVTSEFPRPDPMPWARLQVSGPIPRSARE